MPAFHGPREDRASKFCVRYLPELHVQRRSKRGRHFQSEIAPGPLARSVPGMYRETRGSHQSMFSYQNPRRETNRSRPEVEGKCQ